MTSSDQAKAEERIARAVDGGWTSLDLSGLWLTSLPESITKLDRLRDLDLSRNSFTSLPEPLLELTELRSLSLFKNKLAGPLSDGIGNLGQMRHLMLAYNELTELSENLGDLSELEVLVASYNRLQRLPESLGKCRKLRLLSVSGNPELKKLPRSLLSLPRLEDIGLSGTGLGLPAGLLGSDKSEDIVFGGHHVSVHTSPALPSDLLAYHYGTQDDSKPLNEVKLMLLGRGGAGKSSIRDRLLHDRFDPDKKETPGIEIDSWSLDVDGDDVRVHVWDFAGQVITHATHQFFLTERSVYLLVLDGRAETHERDAEYWMRVIEAFGGDSPVIVVLNKWDQHPFEVDEFGLRERFPQIQGFVRSDCATRTGIDDLHRAIVEAVDGMESVRQPFPAVWASIKSYFGRMKGNYVGLKEFREECAKRGEEDPSRQEALARTLHALGIILHYASDPRLRYTTVLNPEWVTSSIYSLLRLKEGPDSDGEMTLSEARAALPSETEEAVRYLIELMRRFELCFPLDEEGEAWLVPELLPRYQPELESEWRTPEALRLRYEYSVLPEGLIPRLITRTYPLSEEGLRWRTGVTLEMDDAKALVRADTGRYVNVTILGSDVGQRRLAMLIRAQFQGLHEEMERIDAKEELEISGHPDNYKSVRTLLLDEGSERTTTIDTDEGSQSIDERQELDRISEADGRQPDAPRLKLFVSYAREDSRLFDVFELNLSVLQGSGHIERWTDRLILPGSDWDSEVRSELDDAEVIVMLVSTPFLASGYIQSVEMRRALERAAEGSAKLVSVILEDCAWQDQPFARYQVIEPGGKAVRSRKPHQSAFNDVQRELQPLLEELLAKRRTELSGEDGA